MTPLHEAVYPPRVNSDWETIIIGGGASGLMCAAESALRGLRTLVLDCGNRPGRKVLMAGGGKCNFTNRDVGAEHYFSANSHFCKSALSRFTQWDFLALMEEYGISWEERNLGRLFATESSREILDMLTSRARKAGASLKMGVSIESVNRDSDGSFSLVGGRFRGTAPSLVIATGGVSIPDSGAGPLGYRIAEQFGIPVMPISPGLVPFTLNARDKALLSPLSGIAVEVVVTAGGKPGFRENLLFTHRGLSGPAVLQASNAWNPGEDVLIDLLPRASITDLLESARTECPGTKVRNLISRTLPKRLIAALCSESLAEKTIASLIPRDISELSGIFHDWRIRPGGTEGYRSAEVTRGGVSTDGISSKTFESRDVPGLFFIGEVLDVTGQLGGYNLQWAWSSGYCAGQAV